jgi:hypothetical protein
LLAYGLRLKINLLHFRDWIALLVLVERGEGESVWLIRKKNICNINYLLTRVHKIRLCFYPFHPKMDTNPVSEMLKVFLA